MREFFQGKNFTPATLTIISQANSIIDEYIAQGYVLTLRQLYYQFVARNLISNNQRSYNRLGSIISDARVAGEISWTAIEDRTRSVEAWLIEEDTKNVFKDIEYNIACDFWADQSTYVEVWVEKEALSSVIRKPCRRYSVPLLACKGYLSSSEAWRSAKRFEKAIDEGYRCVLIHLGDHDPSGLDMTDDNKHRIHTYSHSMDDIEVRRIALNMNQVERYEPPPNPTKITDSRANKYISQYGDTSWELDAIEPSILDELIDEEISGLIDPDIWDESLKRQKDKRQTLIKLRKNWRGIEKFINEKY